MNYEDFETLDPSQTIPAAEGAFTSGMGITLVMFLLAVGVLTTFVIKRKKATANKEALPGGKHWKFTAVGLLFVAGVSALTFTAEAVTPNQQKVVESHAVVLSNYDELFKSYGLVAPEETKDLRIGNVVGATQENSGEPVVVKIAMKDGEVVLTNLAGGEYLSEKDDQ